MTRAEALAARRATLTPTSGTDARREAHRALRAVRGAAAAYYSRSAISAAVWPSREFASLAAWRVFLLPLYPGWAVKIGVGLFDSQRVVLLEVDMPPRARRRPDAGLIDVQYYAASGFVSADGLWRIEPGEPLTDDGEPAYRAKVAAVVSASRAGRDAQRARLARIKPST